MLRLFAWVKYMFFIVALLKRGCWSSWSLKFCKIFEFELSNFWFVYWTCLDAYGFILILNFDIYRLFILKRVFIENGNRSTNLRNYVKCFTLFYYWVYILFYRAKTVFLKRRRQFLTFKLVKKILWRIFRYFKV